jgi:hypothetical protein
MCTDRDLAVVVALGTRGDVQPLAVLAVALQQRGWRVSLVTHTQHLSWLRRAAGGLHSVLELKEPPARQWDGQVCNPSLSSVYLAIPATGHIWPHRC